MQIKITGKQVELSEALRTYVTRELEAIVTKYFDNVHEAQVTFGRARSFFTCDINVYMGNGLLLRGEGEAADARAAFDDAAEHIAKRLRRYHRWLVEHVREAAHRERPQPARQYILRQTEATEPAETSQQIIDHATYATVVAEMPTEISELSVGEAVMRMDLADQPVLMFRNRATGQLNVVYRRNDGNIGWIDPSEAEAGETKGEEQ